MSRQFEIKKREEQFILNRFFERKGISHAIKGRSLPEKPDFVVNDGTKDIGIELRRLTISSPASQIVSLQGKFISEV